MQLSDDALLDLARIIREQADDRSAAVVLKVVVGIAQATPDEVDDISKRIMTALAQRIHCPPD